MMHLRLCFILMMFVLLVYAVGCSGSSGDPVTGSTIEEPSLNIDDFNSHHAWGLWQFTAYPQEGRLDVVQLRSGNLHLNALPFLEPPALIYLMLENLQFNGNIIEADIGLKHPFLGLTEFTGFDVCGILITNGSVDGFNDPAFIMAGEGDTKLLNPDGWTRWWNPSEFPVNQGTMFSYNDGLLGAPDSLADYNCTLNAYKYFCDDLGPDDSLDAITLDSRGVFSAGQKNIRHYTIELGNDGLVFNYAVDANWQLPSGTPPYIVPDDFGSNANRPEAYRIAVGETLNTLYNDGNTSGGDLSLSIDIYDWFDAGLNTVKIESPGNFAIQSSSSPTGGGPGYSTYIIDITDATPQEGDIDLLIHTESGTAGYGGLLSGETVTAYFVHAADVSDEPPVDDMGWARTWGGSGSDWVYGVAEDSSKNVYVTGFFSGTVNFNPDPVGTPENHSSSGGYDVFLSKFNYQGNLIWTKTWGGSSSDLARAIGLDSSGNIYVAGQFEGSADFNPNTGTPVILSSNGGRDPFVSKFDADGNLIWAKSWGGASDDYGRGVAADGAGNVYVGGYFEGSADFDTGTGAPEVHASNGGRDPYLIKLNSSGDLQWVNTWGGGDHDYGTEIDCDGSGNVCITGHFTGTVNFNPDPMGTPANYASVGLLDMYVSKFDTDGELQWARTWGSDTYDYASRVAIDGFGNVLAAGDFQHSCDFNPWGTPLVLYAGNMDPCVSKFDSDGNFQWAKAWGGSGHDRSYGVAADNDGNVCVSGHFNGTVNFNPNPGDPVNYTSNGMTDAYVIKLDSNGDLQWAHAWGASLNDFAYVVGMGATGNIIVGGEYQETVDFSPDPGSPDNHTSNGGYDHFVIKYLPDGTW